MVSEFVRFGVPEFRRLTGALEVAAAAGLGLGLIAPVLGVIASGGLALLMLLALGVRWKIRDSAVQTTPAFLYMLLNVYLLSVFLKAM